MIVLDLTAVLEMTDVAILSMIFGAMFFPVNTVAHQNAVTEVDVMKMIANASLQGD